MVTTKVHYHSDCPFFAGCENMLAVLLNSDELRASYNISFSFRFSAEYFDGYRSRVNDDVPLYPLNFTDFSDMIKLPVWFPQGVRRFLMVLTKIITTWPLMAYQIYKLTRLFNKIKPDIVHTFLPYAGIVGRVVAFLSGVKNIISTQCNVPVAYSFKVYLLDKITLLLVKLWIAPTEGIEYEYSGSIAIYNTKAYLEGRKHFTINFAIDTVKINKALENIDRPKKRRELNIPENVKVVAMTARLHTWKGQEDLIDAMAKLDANIHLVLIGDGVMKQSLEAQVRSLDIEGRVHFLGTRSDVFEILAISDIYVQAHRIEKDKVWVGRNSAQTEAAAIGLPSISTNVPLIEEFIQDGVNGKIVESNNPEMMAQAIKWFLDNPERSSISS